MSRFFKYLKEEIATASVPDGSGTETDFNSLIPDEKKGFKKKSKIFKRKLDETDSGNIAYIPFYYGDPSPDDLSYEDNVDTDNLNNVLGVHSEKHVIGNKEKKKNAKTTSK